MVWGLRRSNGLFFDLGVVPRHPADLILQQYGVPPIRCGSDVSKHRAILHSGDPGESGAVALADIHRADRVDDDSRFGRQAFF